MVNTLQYMQYTTNHNVVHLKLTYVHCISIKKSLIIQEMGSSQTKSQSMDVNIKRIDITELSNKDFEVVTIHMLQ